MKIWAALHGVVMLAEQGLLTGQVAHISREELVEDIVEQTKTGAGSRHRRRRQGPPMTVRVPNSRESGNTDVYAGIVIGISTVAALIVANSPLGHQFEALLQTTGEVRIGSIGLGRV